MACARKTSVELLERPLQQLRPLRADRYAGLTRAGYTNRRRLHQAQIHGVSKYTMDQYHVNQQKRGQYRTLSFPFLDEDENPGLTTEFLHVLEVRSFLLLRVNHNTKNQARSGREDLRVLH